jgi:hypothetical protein
MDEYRCYITCKGERKGPFTLTQLKRMRVDDMLPEDAFTPEEWAALNDVLDSKDVSETRFWSRNRYVEVKKIEREESYTGLLKLLITFNWICDWGVFRGVGDHPSGRRYFLAFAESHSSDVLLHRAHARRGAEARQRQVK